MNNHKIRVNNEAESKEAQELFFELGYEWKGHDGELKHLNQEWINANENGYLTFGFTGVEAQKQITLPQLRDLVVLHRNDVKDATHQDKYDASLKYVYLNGGWYEWIDGWKTGSINSAKLMLIQEQQDGLISGKDALRALADGKEVEVRKHKEWNSCDIAKATAVDYFINDYYEFRLKPRTVKLEIEVPAPFVPKIGEFYYCISPFDGSGYTRYRKEDNYGYGYEQYGAWRTEAEIKIVVEQIRKLKEHSK